VLSIVHAPFGLFLLVALLVLSLVVGRASTSAIHLINSANFTVSQSLYQAFIHQNFDIRTRDFLLKLFNALSAARLSRVAT
jgi:hypothetical protein